MKIALVGPGLLPIPPNGWGAVEILVWKYNLELQALGHEVTIFNSRNLKKVIAAIDAGDFDFVHVHYDEFAHYFSKHCKTPFCITSHYGYILKKTRWSMGYFSIFVDFLSVPGIIALSAPIQQLYLGAGYQGQSYVLKNSIEVARFAFKEKGNGRVLCLGKIEPRKQQAQLAQILEGKIAVDFVGPIVDHDFIAGETCRYKGVWTKDEVQERLTEYSVLLLLSDGEAAPLVVIEALAAGLSVVISKSASANLEQKPFITLLEDNMLNGEYLAHILQEAVEKNNGYRNEVRAYALCAFDSRVCMQAYVDIIHDIVQKKPTVVTNGYKQEHLVRYYFSRIWLWLSGIAFLRKVKGWL